MILELSPLAIPPIAVGRKVRALSSVFTCVVHAVGVEDAGGVDPLYIAVNTIARGGTAANVEANVLLLSVRN